MSHAASNEDQAPSGAWRKNPHVVPAPRPDQQSEVSRHAAGARPARSGLERFSKFRMP